MSIKFSAETIENDQILYLRALAEACGATQAAAICGVAQMRPNRGNPLPTSSAYKARYRCAAAVNAALAALAGEVDE